MFRTFRTPLEASMASDLGEDDHQDYPAAQGCLHLYILDHFDKTTTQYWWWYQSIEMNMDNRKSYSGIPNIDTLGLVFFFRLDWRSGRRPWSSCASPCVTARPSCLESSRPRQGKQQNPVGQLSGKHIVSAFVYLMINMGGLPNFQNLVSSHGSAWRAY